MANGKASSTAPKRPAARSASRSRGQTHALRTKGVHLATAASPRFTGESVSLAPYQSNGGQDVDAEQCFLPLLLLFGLYSGARAMGRRRMGGYGLPGFGGQGFGGGSGQWGMPGGLWNAMGMGNFGFGKPGGFGLPGFGKPSGFGLPGFGGQSFGSAGVPGSGAGMGGLGGYGRPKWPFMF